MTTIINITEMKQGGYGWQFQGNSNVTLTKLN